MLAPNGLVAECTGENIFASRNGHHPHAAAVGRRARGHHPELGDDDRPRPRLRRAASTTSPAATCTSPRRCSCAAPPPRSARSTPSTTASVPCPGPMTKAIAEVYARAVRGEEDAVQGLVRARRLSAVGWSEPAGAARAPRCAAVEPRAAGALTIHASQRVPPSIRSPGVPVGCGRCVARQRVPAVDTLPLPGRPRPDDHRPSTATLAWRSLARSRCPVRLPATRPASYRSGRPVRRPAPTRRRRRTGCPDRLADDLLARLRSPACRLALGTGDRDDRSARDPADVRHSKGLSPSVPGPGGVRCPVRATLHPSPRSRVFPITGLSPNPVIPRSSPSSTVRAQVVHSRTAERRRPLLTIGAVAAGRNGARDASTARTSATIIIISLAHVAPPTCAAEPPSGAALSFLGTPRTTHRQHGSTHEHRTAIVEVFDTTLRDGLQVEGVSATVDDKLRIAEQLDHLGVHFIEGGWPGANPKDIEFFARAATELQLDHVDAGRVRLDPPAEGQGRRRRHAAQPARRRHVGGVHRRQELGLPRARGAADDARRGRGDDRRLASSSSPAHGRRVLVDMEHFFDGYKRNPEFSLRALEAAVVNGRQPPRAVRHQRRLAAPRGRARSSATCTRHVGDDVDRSASTATTTPGCAVANSMAAVRAGAGHVQGTLNGLGERTGNCNLTTVIPNLQLKLGLHVPARRPASSG